MAREPEPKSNVPVYDIALGGHYGASAAVSDSPLFP
jgi:hypothetical protein